MDPFNFPAIGDSRAVGYGKFGSTSGSSTDIIYPTAKLVDDAFQPGRVLNFEWKADQHRFWSPKNTRLFMELELAYGEVDATCSDAVTGPEDGKEAPPSRSLRMSALPAAQVFDSQMRFSANNTVVEQTNFYADMAQAQVLTTTNIEGSDTSGSNMLLSLRKDAGVPSGIMLGQQAAQSAGDSYQRVPVSSAPYVTLEDGTRAASSDQDSLGHALSTITQKDVKLDGFVAAVEVATTIVDRSLLTLKLSTTSEAEAVQQRNALALASGTGSIIVADATEHFKKIFNNAVATDGAALATTTASLFIDRTVVKANADGTFKGATADVIILGAIATTIAKDTEFKLGAIEDAITFEDPVNAPLSHVAQCLSVKVPSNASKHTTQNPKSDILQQGYHPGTKRTTLQVMEPVMLTSWQAAGHYAMPSGSYSLSATISPNYLKDLLYDPSGQYGCPGRTGEALPYGATLDVAKLLKGTVAVRVKEVALHVSYIHPIESFIPKSISLKTNPIQVAKRQLRTQNVQESFTISPSTKAVMCFLVQDFAHLCADAELDGRAKAGAGVNALGITDDTTGKFTYDSRALQCVRDADIDPREPSAIGGLTANAANDYTPATVLEVKNGAASVNLEKTAPMYWESLQVQLGADVQPRDMLTQQSPPTGLLSRAWSLYTNFIAKSAGFRGSVMSYSEFCGYVNSTFNSGARCGDRGPFHMFSIQNPAGSLSSDLQIRGSLSGAPNDVARQFLVVMSISESMFDIAYQAPSPVPVMTRIRPLS